MISPKDAAWWTAVLIIIRDIVSVLSASSREEVVENTAVSVLLLFVYPAVAYLIVKAYYTYTNKKASDQSSGNDKTYYFKVIGASVVCSVVFSICFIVLTPFAVSVMDWFGRYFVPARYGGGSEIDNLGIMNSILRLILFVSASGYAGFQTSIKLFPEVRARHLIYGLIVVLCIAFFSVKKIV